MELDNIVSLILGVSGLGVSIAVAVYVLGKIKTSQPSSPPSVHELMAQFRDLYESGEISPSEFRAIREQFAESLLEYASSRDASKETAETLEKASRASQLDALLRNERR